MLFVYSIVCVFFVLPFASFCTPITAPRAPVDSLLEAFTEKDIKNGQIPTTYDYIIVGGGGGGLLAAMRLTENPQIKVAVIEAGAISNAFFTIQPGQLATSVFVDPTVPLNPNIDWLDVTVPVKANGVAQHYPQGRMLGGSTARGFSAYTRATKGAYQKWAQTVGDDGYTWEKFEPYLRKPVQFTPPNMSMRFSNSSDIKFKPASFSPEGGPLDVSFSNFVSPFGTWMHKAFLDANATAAEDFNDGTLNGIQYVPTNIQPKDMHRADAVAFFEASRNRPNLNVFTKMQGMKITFDTKKVATGVMVKDIENNTFPMTATREVIASAGVFRTPQLLMVSGIGPAQTLAQFRIEPISDLPLVGQKLEDQPFVGSTYQVNMNTTSQIFNKDFFEFENNTMFPQADGVLAATVDMVSFEKFSPQLRATLSKNVTDVLDSYPEDWPHMQFLPVNADLLIFRTVESKPPNEQVLVPNFGSISAAIQVQQSRGSVSIRSADMSDPPVVDIGYLNDERDVELLVAAFKRSREVWKTPALKPALIGNEYWPGYDVVPDNDEAIRNHVIQQVMPIWEATSSCAMGKDPSTGVVDSQGRVFGVQGLRVLDVSALPFMPPGHPAASMWGMVERITDLMKAGFTANMKEGFIGPR